MAKPILSSTPTFGPRDAQAVRHLRHVFWQNVVQQMLTAFPKRALENPDLTDGRVAVLTRDGERIGIKSVQPLFACSVPGAAGDRAISIAVQCTVFEIHTPEGQVYTLPIEEIRAVHALSEDLVNQLQQIVDESEPDADAQQFGFAAFTSLARQQRDMNGQVKS